MNFFNVPPLIPGSVLRALCLLGFATVASAADLPVQKFDDTGFETIFAGKSLDGWHVSSQTGHSGTSQNKSGGKWILEDGAIVGSQDIPGNGGIILTDKQYGDFEVIVEMHNDYGPDSGLFLRSNEKGPTPGLLKIWGCGGNEFIPVLFCEGGFEVSLAE